MRLETLQDSLDRYGLLAEDDKQQLGTHPSNGMDASAEGDNLAVFLCAPWVSKLELQDSPYLELTGKIQVLEQLSILMIPPLAHIHAEGPVQASDLFRPLSHEIVRCHPGKLLPLLLLDLEALFVHAAPLSLLLNEVPATPIHVGRGAGSAGIVGAFRKLQLRV
jgi:hypothetical protein